MTGGGVGRCKHILQLMVVSSLLVSLQSVGVIMAAIVRVQPCTVLVCHRNAATDQQVGTISWRVRATEGRPVVSIRHADRCLNPRVRGYVRGARGDIRGIVFILVCVGATVRAVNGQWGSGRCKVVAIGDEGMPIHFRSVGGSGGRIY